ncbi:glycerate kinase [Fibrella forsythiae]|uniref:Glycerate kinase n=1 Tax=Fibrella forsythiae TaxID=2817061 RepID=A0ABS3JDP2_9BACT|nr:glycerate kinase [Fibrella forsythiae]MBO0948114.1 glycerate kinase [Fibrella forsythiae]
MHVLVVPDKFKGSLTAQEAAEAIRAGFHRHHPNWTITIQPIADGGEGTVALLTQATLGTFRTCTVSDPLGRPITASFGLSGDGKTAFVELAEASGLHLLTYKERNPLYTSTFGTGQLIRQALETGVTELVLCIGGSATNDAGIGIAAALGFQFLDAQDQPLFPSGNNLVRIARIDRTNVAPALSQVRIRVACDVTNPLYGPTGAAYVYGHQKGANATAQRQLDDGLRHIATIVEQTQDLSVAQEPGNGAAGGVGFGARVFLQAQLEPGFALVAHYTGLAETIRHTDLIITGEGKLDTQTLHGKAVRGIAVLANAANKPVVAFCGKLALNEAQLEELGVQKAVQISPAHLTTDEARKQAFSLLREAVADTYPAS